MDTLDKTSSRPGEKPFYHIRRISLATLLSLTIAGITVVTTLITAFTMFKVFDDQLTIEFQDRIISESEEFSQKIRTRLQHIDQQLKLFALDNSVRVTLMLDVDYQLQERITAHNEKHQGIIHFIVKNNSEIIVSNDKAGIKDLISHFVEQNTLDGRIFRTEDGKFYVGFTSPINSREKLLGNAGSIYHLHPHQYIHPRNQQQGARLLYSAGSQSFYDLESGSEIKINSQGIYQRGLVEIQDISIEKNEGYLVQLENYTKLHYFMPSTELMKARQEGIINAFFLSFAGALLATILAIWLSNRISRPLNSLVLATKNIAGGAPDAYQLPQQSLIAELYEFSHALIRIVHTLKKDEEKIRRQANYDPLSGLPNRSLFLDRFVGAIKRAKRSNTRIALMFIDLDQFKHINDTLGHSAGDQLLQLASLRLVDIVRSSDTVARLGGDEFTVLMPDLSEIHPVEDVVSKILETLSASFQLEENEAYVSASIGITIYPDDGAEAGQLLRNADSAMYRAKDKGRNNAQFFTIEMNQHAKRRRKLEVALRQALEKDQLELHYQPIYQTSNKQIIGAEALLRWNLTDHEPVSPSEFIPLAEDTGLILPIGEWIMKTACHAAQKWNQQYHQPLRIAVNISSCQFQRADVLQLVKDSIKLSGLDPKLLTIEITESLLLSNNDETMNTLNSLRKMGIEIAIDDFGTGYSSLSYLKRFPVTTLKIDRSFIDDLPEDREDAALVEAIISMSQSLKLKLVAEGVETSRQYQFLKDRNCAMIQGYFLSKPLTLENFEHYLHNIPTIIPQQ